MAGYPWLIFLLCLALGAAVPWLTVRLLVMWVTLD